jgi:hypothetical protein
MSGKAVRETLGFLAVVASMAFVGWEIRQNTVASQAAEQNDIYDASREIELAVAADPEWSRIVVEGRSEGGLSSVEQYRYDVYVQSTLDLWDQLLTRYDDGLMDPATIEAWSRYFEQWVERHLSEAAWQRIEWQFEGAMPQSVEAALLLGSNE